MPDQGTLRAGTGEAQIRYEQSLWNSGTDRCGRNESGLNFAFCVTERTGVKTAELAGARVRNSLDVREGREDSPVFCDCCGARQQTGIGQLEEGCEQHLSHAGLTAAAGDTGAVVAANSAIRPHISETITNKVVVLLTILAVRDIRPVSFFLTPKPQE